MATYGEQWEREERNYEAWCKEEGREPFAESADDPDYAEYKRQRAADDRADSDMRYDRESR